MELQTIDTSKWQWMMVSNNGCLWRKSIVFYKLSEKFIALDNDFEEIFIDGTLKNICISLHLIPWPHAKPIEQRKNTALDVMWWGGTRNVFRYKINKDRDIYPLNRLSTVNNISDKEYNELHLIDGHAELKHEKWLTADELDIV